MAALEVVTSLFSAFWEFLTGVQVPGIGISFASWFLALTLIGIALDLISHALGFGGGSGYRSSSGGKKHISENRKGDEK